MKQTSALNHLTVTVTPTVTYSYCFICSSFEKFWDMNCNLNCVWHTQIFQTAVLDDSFSHFKTFYTQCSPLGPIHLLVYQELNNSIACRMYACQVMHEQATSYLPYLLLSEKFFKLPCMTLSKCRVKVKHKVVPVL